MRRRPRQSSLRRRRRRNLPRRQPQRRAAAPAAKGETGLAAVYSDKLNGHKTASGQVYHRDQLTAAHKTLPFGTQVKVTNTKNGKSVVVRINDRGPVQEGRVLDLSAKAAAAIGIKPNAMAEVSLEVVGEPPPKAAKSAKPKA